MQKLCITSHSVFGEKHTIENTLDVLRITHKGKNMNAIEIFHIDNLSRQDLNDNHSITNNSILETALTQS
jgi:hypothetical protein